MRCTLATSGGYPSSFQYGAPVQYGGPVSYAPVLKTPGHVTGVDTILSAYGKVVRTLRCPLSALMRWGQGRCAALPRGLYDRDRETRGFFLVLALPVERCSSVLRLASMDESESESESESSSSSSRVKHVCFAFVTPEFCSHCRSEQQIQVSFSICCSVDTSISVRSVFCLLWARAG